MIELNESRIENIMEVVTEQTFGTDTKYKDGILLWKEFISAPIGEAQNCLLNTMDGFELLCDKYFTKKEWDMQVRNVSDVENFFAMILWAVKEEQYKQLREDEKKKLQVLYAELGLETDDTEWTGDELDVIGEKKWLTNRNEAYKFVYKLYHAVAAGKVTKEHIGTGRYYDMVDCLLSTYIDCVAKYQTEIQKAYERIDVKVNWSDYCNHILKDKRRQKDIQEYVMVNWKEEAREAVSTEDLPEDIAVITLLGGAGVGKSTALQYLQYKACQKYRSGDKSVKIPVLIRLKNVKESGVEKTIFQLLCEELQVEDAVLNEVLWHEPIRIFFDGFNEVPVENHVQERVKHQINDLIDNYGVPIMVTDRTGETGIEPADYRLICREYTLVNLDANQVREYFRRKTKDLPAVVERIETELTETLAWVLTEPVTPYQLEVIVGLAIRGENFGDRDVLMQRHLKALFKRELRQRDRQEVNRLRKWLRAISKSMVNQRRNSISRSAMEMLLPNLDYGPFFIWARDLMILYADRDSVRFVSEEYCNFFINYVTDEGTENKGMHI